MQTMQAAQVTDMSIMLNELINQYYLPALLFTNALVYTDLVSLLLFVVFSIAVVICLLYTSGLLGRNGAGKTTTMKMLLGLTKPTSGEVKIYGKSLQGNEKKLLPRIGSLIESPGFYPNLTATENLRIFATLRGVPNNHAIKDALDLVGLPYKDKKLFTPGIKPADAISRNWILLIPNCLM